MNKIFPVSASNSIFFSDANSVAGQWPRWRRTVNHRWHLLLVFLVSLQYDKGGGENASIQEQQRTRRGRGHKMLRDSLPLWVPHSRLVTSFYPQWSYHVLTTTEVKTEVTELRMSFFTFDLCQWREIYSKLYFFGLNYMYQPFKFIDLLIRRRDNSP